MPFSLKDGSSYCFTSIQKLDDDGLEGTGGHTYPTPVTAVAVDEWDFTRIERYHCFGWTRCLRRAPLTYMAPVFVDVRYL